MLLVVFSIANGCGMLGKCNACVEISFHVSLYGLQVVKKFYVKVNTMLIAVDMYGLVEKSIEKCCMLVFDVRICKNVVFVAEIFVTYFFSNITIHLSPQIKLWEGIGVEIRRSKTKVKLCKIPHSSYVLWHRIENMTATSTTNHDIDFCLMDENEMNSALQKHPTMAQVTISQKKAKSKLRIVYQIQYTKTYYYSFDKPLLLLRNGNIEVNPGPMPIISETQLPPHKQRYKTYFITCTIKLQQEYQHLAKTFSPIPKIDHSSHINAIRNFPNLIRYLNQKRQYSTSRLLFALITTISSNINSCKHQLINIPNQD